MSDVLWQGKFDLNQALNDFGAFATAVEARMGKLAGKNIGKGFSDDLKKGAKEAVDSLDDVEKKAKETEDGLKKVFTGLTIGGFALQRFGTFLTREITEPLIALGKHVLDTTELLDNFERTLTIRGNKTPEQINEIYDAVKRVSSLPNLKRPDVIEFFTRLEEVTKGKLGAHELEQIGTGLANVLNSLPQQKLSRFLGQVQEVLGGGGVSNLQRTLNEAPLLGVVYKRLAEEAKAAGTQIDQTTLLFQAFVELSKLPPIFNLTTQIKALKNEFFEFGRRIGEVYKTDLLKLINFILTTVIPVISNLITKLEKSGPLVHSLTLILVGLGLVLPPLITTIGAFAIAIGGVGYAIETIFGVTLAAAIAGAAPAIAAFVVSFGAIIAIVGVASATLTYLAINNFGGLGDAATSLASTLKTTLFSQLGDLISIVKDLGSAIVSLFTLLDRPVFTGLGMVLSALLSIIELVALAMTAAVNAVAILIHLPMDASIEGWSLAWAKFNLAIMESLKLFTDTFPNVAKLIYFITGLFTSNTQTIEQAIEKQKNKIHELGGAIDHDKELIKEVAVAHSQWSMNVDETTEAVKKLTDALRSEATAILDAQNASSKAISTYQSQKQQTGLTDQVKKMREAAFAKDLTDPAQAAAALEEIKKSNAINLEAAKIAQNQSVLDALRGAYEKNREQVRKLAEDETNATLQDIYLGAAQAYENAQMHPENQKQVKDLLGNISKVLDQVSGVPSDRMSKIKRDFELQAYNIKLASTTASQVTKAMDDAQRDNAAQLDKYAKEQEKIRKHQEALEKQGPLVDTLTVAEANVTEAEDKRKVIGRNIEEIISITQLNKDLTEALSKSQEAEKARYVAEIAVINASDQNAADKADAIAKAGRKSSEKLAQMQVDEKRQFTNTIQTIVGDKGGDSKRIHDLLLSFGDEIKSDIDTALDLAAVGIKPSQEKVDSLVKDYNTIIKETSDVLKQGAFKTITDSIDSIYEVGKKLDTNGVYADRLFKFLENFKDSARHPLTQSEIDSLLKESEGLLTFMANALKMGNFADSADKADVELAVKKMLKFIEDLKAARKALADIADDKTIKAQIDLSNIEHQKTLNDLLRDQLDLEKQILDERAKQSQIPGAPGLTNIISVISGSAKAARDAQLAILDNERKAAELQLKIDLDRLYIEELILEKKIQESDLSQEEKDKEKGEARDLYNQEVAAIKEKGKLSQELILEQIKTIKNGVSGGGILGSIIGIFTSGGKKKADSDKGADAASGALGTILDDKSTDNNVKNAQKNSDWLDQLGGKIGKTRDLIFGLGDAVASMGNLSIKGLLKALADELKALAKYAAVKALEFAALAISAAVFGDHATAVKATHAAIAWGVVAAAAGVAGAFLGSVTADSTANAASSASNSAGVSSDSSTTPNNSPTVLKQQALSVWIALDIRADDGVTVKKVVNSIKKNTELTTLTSNSQQGWYFPVTP